MDPLRHAHLYCPRCGQPMGRRQEGDKVRPACTACDYVQYLNPSPAAAVIVMRDGKLCLVRRKYPPREGMWTLPAGFMEYDEEIEETAVREVREETGLDVRLNGLFAVHNGILPPDRPVLLVVYRGEEIGGELCAGDDAAAVGFYDLEALPGPIAFAAHRKVLDALRGQRPGAPVPVAVLLSGSGRTLENFLMRIAAGTLPIRIVGVVSSRPDVRGVEIARAAGLPCGIFRRRDYPGAAAHSAAINAWLEPLGPRMILLAGYLCYYVPPAWLGGPVLNIHPALLPRYGGKGFYGDRVHAAVLASGDTESGCTVHLVDDQYDHGTILAQRRVPVLPGDDVHSLAERVFAAECELYPEIITRLARDL